MIKPGEIQKKAHSEGVRDHQIEKDYILSWMLSGIANHLKLSQILVFKGGTVLKKIYFKNYRFSEDLDFTLLIDQSASQSILDWFKEAFLNILEHANIPLEILDVNENVNGINFYISYVGPLGGVGKNKRVKIDISSSERLAFTPVKKRTFLEYSDLQPCELLCYSLEEVLLEKLRCVMQRMQARDFYDIWYLLEVTNIDLMMMSAEFDTKCRLKNLDAKDFFQKMNERLPQYKALWEKSIGDQIRDLPDYQTVERETLRKLRALNV